ncbi:Z1 domain-containing protein [Ruegeria atlantica]|uniref:Z1 domain-containing protein n=1 Tax=Ruegeria atlantica TaxID=81569 RepID=UPI0024954675|nr:Z1 domain-containing protein [Ruegeria atlantica]
MQNEFQDVVKTAQTLLDRHMKKTGEEVTPDLIDRQLTKLEIVMEDAFETVDRDEVVLELIRRFSRSSGRSATLQDGEDHQPWLNAGRKSDWKYWPRYAEHLEGKLPLSAVESIDEATDEILGNLEDPKRTGAWDRRGLVVGHVQSGKTGNYTGLICKAADAGYKIIIVLAGLHNNLRAQTQIRLDEGFLGYATLVNVDELPRVGVGLLDSDHSYKPNCATNRSDRGDFNKHRADSLNVSPEEKPWLFVVKKNKTVLERLQYWIDNHAWDTEEPDSKRKLVSKLPLLIIDDESDHGSVDTGEKPVDDFGNVNLEHDPKTINKLIRQILHSFTRKAYVGYTATPFANIFIHSKGQTDQHGPDLFPSAFISSLAAPSNYIGPGRVFGASSTNQEELPLVRGLAQEEYSEWMPQGHKNGYRPRISGEANLPESLQEAIRAFIFACAVRKLRGQGSRHSSMLIHVSRFTSVQAEVVTQVGDYVRLLTRRWTRGIELYATESQMREEYEKQFLPGMATIRRAFRDEADNAVFGWEELRRILPEVLEDIEVREINGSAKEALDYAENEHTGLKVIAVGGDKLARGLTLEGLCTSYFLRTARMYDTLMQMGRWFGYRDAYLDVCRLYTTEEMVKWFGHIAEAAEELRQEFDNMAAQGATPREFGLRVKSHSSMTITSRAKMKSARPVFLTFSGDLLQTITFSKDQAILQRNLDAGHRFVRSMGVGRNLDGMPGFFTGDRHWNGHWWSSVPAQNVIDFLRSYETHPSSFRVVSPLVADFIEQMNTEGELTDWTVALVGTGDAPSEHALGDHTVRMLKRTFTGKDEGRHSIRTLISPWDQAIGLSEAEWVAAMAHTHRTWKQDVERGQTQAEPTEPRGTAIRYVLGPEGMRYGLSPSTNRGLIMLYLIDPRRSGGDHLADCPPVLAWAVSFPGSASRRTVSNADYMANAVAWGDINEYVD